jgi:hypothetical protein
MIVLTREQWGASAEFPRKGSRVARLDRTEVYIHHTVFTDNDASPNEFEDLNEVKSRMRVLQTIRPDLGKDVPYSMVAFCMADGQLVLCEGRGLDRSGAHTRGHNESALGIAFQGNFQTEPLPRHFDDQLASLGKWLNGLILKEGFFNLGRVRPGGRDLWGHRDLKPTQCPGQQLYDKLGLIRFVEDEMVMDKATWKAVQRALQALNPPLYAGKAIDGIPGRNTDIAVQAFERRQELTARGVVGEANDPEAGIWPATRELLFAAAAATP